MDQQEAVIKLKALQQRLNRELENQKARYFRPSQALEYFDLYTPLRDFFRENLPGLLGDFPVRTPPAPNLTTDFDGEGHVTRWQLEPLLKDMNHMISILDASSPSVVETQTLKLSANDNFDKQQPNIGEKIGKLSLKDRIENDPIYWISRALFVAISAAMGITFSICQYFLIQPLKHDNEQLQLKIKDLEQAINSLRQTHLNTHNADPDQRANVQKKKSIDALNKIITGLESDIEFKKSELSNHSPMTLGAPKPDSYIRLEAEIADLQERLNKAKDQLIQTAAR